MTGEKKSGSFYTPNEVVNFMVQYVYQRIHPTSILEPSAGDGRFVEALLNKNAAITSVEFSREKTRKLEELYRNQCKVITDDFLHFSLCCDEKFQLIIGNPPYIRKKTINKEQIDNSLQILQTLNLEKSVFQNIWVSFILASIKLLDLKGAIFFVLPFEFLQVQYAEKLRSFLEEKFNIIEITTFEERVFPEIEQDVCLVYLSNEEKKRPYISYTTLKNTTDPDPVFHSIIMRNKPLKKWSNCILNDFETEMLKMLAQQFPRIADVGETSPGIVTGNNNFFVLSEQEVSENGLSENYFSQILMKSVYIPSLLLLNDDDIRKIEENKLPMYLLNLNHINAKDFSKSLIQYLQRGKELEVDKKYKCAHRRRWYDVPITKNGDICFFRRYHNFPRIISNHTNFLTTDVAYNIRLSKKYEADSFAFCFYNSLTLALCEYNGRFYGGGVGEMVPKEFQELHVPYCHIEKENIEKLDYMIRHRCDLQDIVDFVDSVVLLGLSSEQIQMLQDIRKKYVLRRLRLS